MPTRREVSRDYVLTLVRAIAENPAHDVIYDTQHRCERQFSLILDAVNMMNQPLSLS